MSLKPLILCIDDEKIVLDAIRLELKNAFGNEYTIEVAESGIEALEIIEETILNNGVIPLVVSDYIMPGMKGDEVLEKIKNRNPETYNIMLTGQATIEGVTKAINNAKLYRYISKPWETNDFLMTISEALKSFNREKHIEQQSVEILEQNREIKKKNDEITEINVNLDKLVKIRTKELEDTIDELLKVEIGKKAFTILFIIALTMFLAVDAFIDPLLQQIVRNFYIVLGLKAIIALLIKPVETILEKYLYSKARKTKIKIKVAN